jgi:hypothetical protein
MADVRAMLRASRDARKKITHPHASYTSSGKLVCNLCETTIKHESAWQSHLHTTQHNLRQTRAQDVENTRPSDMGKRKRSASGSASPPAESRKKIRPAAATSPGDSEGEKANEPEISIIGPSEAATDGAFHEVSKLDQADTNGKPRTQDLDDFERELAELEASVPVQTAAYEDATISSAPLSAAELAAQAREEHSAQRGKRDLEIADEREDAAQLLADEFEEMEGLELRAQKLRARREALRTVDANASRNRSEDAGADAGTNMPDPIRSVVQEKPDVQQDDNDNGKEDDSRGDDDDDDDGDDDDDDGDDDGDAYWTFGGR